MMTEVETGTEMKVKVKADISMMSELDKKVDELLASYAGIKLHNKELLAENHQLHAALSRMQEEQLSAGNKVAELVAQLKMMQEQE